MRFIILVAALLLASPALGADTPAEENDVSYGCKWVVLCDAQSGTGYCTSGADNIIAKFKRNYSHTLYAEQSTSASFSATVCSSSDGTTGTCGVTNPAITVTDTLTVLPFDGILSSYWINITSNPSGNVTVWDYVCPIVVGG